MEMLRDLWQRFLTWRQSPGQRPAAAAPVIKKVDISDEDLGKSQRGLGPSEGSMGQG